jgi:hypothetical protein
MKNILKNNRNYTSKESLQYKKRPLPNFLFNNFIWLENNKLLRLQIEVLRIFRIENNISST